MITFESSTPAKYYVIKKEVMDAKWQETTISQHDILEIIPFVGKLTEWCDEKKEQGEKGDDFNYSCQITARKRDEAVVDGGKNNSIPPAMNDVACVDEMLTPQLAYF